MTLDRSYIGYLGFLGIDLKKSVLMYSKGAICLSRLFFKMGLFTVYSRAHCLTSPSLKGCKTETILFLSETDLLNFLFKIEDNLPRIVFVTFIQLQHFCFDRKLLNNEDLLQPSCFVMERWNGCENIPSNDAFVLLSTFLCSFWMQVLQNPPLCRSTIFARNFNGRDRKG
jgi:hypothetical protein